jgi:hypothetical protein
VSREFEQHCCEPANANAHADALAGEDGQFPPPPPTNENGTLVVSFSFVDPSIGVGADNFNAVPGCMFTDLVRS